MTVDQMPHVRALHTCPNCTQPKSVGLLVCWPCNNTLKKKFDGGYGAVIEARLAELNAVFAQRLDTSIAR